MNMKRTSGFVGLLLLMILPALGCGALVPNTTESPAGSPTETAASSEAISSEPSPTPTPALLDLEIVEWHEWPYANLSDPSNTDTHVEMLIRNPNDVPVRVDRDDTGELRFLNSAGEVVYANPNPVFHIWQGVWMLPGETAALSACVCFDTQELQKQEWESLELVAPLEVATDIPYTLDVEVKLGEIVDIAAAHLGGSGFALETNFVNTSDQALESVPHRVLARDASGRYIGVAFAGNAVASFTENIAIQPGNTATGLNVIEINYIDESDLPTLTYEVAAIGIPFQAEATAEFVLPSGTPMAEWEGFPIMTGAISGEIIGNAGYQFTTQASVDEIIGFYETELSRLDFQFELTANESAGYTALYFVKGDITGAVVIAPLGDGLNGVAITMSK